VNRPDYVKSVAEMKLVNGSKAALERIAKSDYKVIIVTNQSAVNRGLLTRETLDRIHSRMLEELGPDCRVDAIYYCPHAPDEKCDCRKPSPGLLRRAAIDLGINLKQSWMIGDSLADKKAGLAAGCRVITVRTNKPFGLSEAVREITVRDGWLT